MSEITRTVMLDGGAESLRLQKFTLTILDDEGKGEPREFGQRTVTMGASPATELTIDDATVSRQHCKIEVDGGGYRLIDLESKNGTRVGELRIREVFLTPGTVFSVGATKVRFDVEDDEVEVRFSASDRFGKMLGASKKMREIFGLLERVAPTDATVLVEGKSGTGKELVAEAIHSHSKRADKPFIVFDCSAVSKDLIESELFGHVKGAFTGAHTDRKGAFEQAQGGTLFIDELGELSSDLQPKLLRALEQREIRRIGDHRVVPIDVRVVAATNCNLREEVAEGNFREDLYYRFAVITVFLPPLKDRKDDIALLVEHFLTDAKERTGNPELNISFSTMEKLKRYDWPGNVRELKNFIDRAVLLSAGKDIETKFMRPQEPASARGTTGEPDGDAIMTAAGIDVSMPFKDAKTLLVEQFEKAYWMTLLERTDGNVSKAARIAGVHRKSVEYILKKLDIDRSMLG